MAPEYDGVRPHQRVLGYNGSDTRPSPDGAKAIFDDQATDRVLGESTNLRLVRLRLFLALVTMFAIALGFTVGGSVLIELIFVYPGVGYTLFQAVARRDYPVMQGILIVTTVCVLVAVTIADALYGWLDPRIRIPAERR